MALSLLDDDTDAGEKIAGTNYQRVCDRLRSDIIDGILSPGTRLKVLDVARRYGLSQMPVREAIQQLQGEGLVVVIPNRGASVRMLDSKFVSDVYDVRMAVEGMLAAQTAARITPDELEIVRELARRHERERGNREACIVNNDRLHMQINAFAGNEEALRICRLHRNILHALRKRLGFRSGRIDAVIEQHREIIDALANHDAERARRLSEDHLKGARDDILATYEG